MFKKELTIIAVNINPYSFPKALGWIDAMGSRLVVFYSRIFLIHQYNYFETNKNKTTKDK
jgi:hypothetical protein